MHSSSNVLSLAPLGLNITLCFAMSILANPVAPLGDKLHLTPKTPLSDTEFRITFARHCSFGHIFIIKMDRALIDCACTAALEARGFLAHERT